jgi:hypothetical protein
MSFTLLEGALSKGRSKVALTVRVGNAPRGVGDELEDRIGVQWSTPALDR